MSAFDFCLISELPSYAVCPKCGRCFWFGEPDECPICGTQLLTQRHETTTLEGHRPSISAYHRGCRCD